MVSVYEFVDNRPRPNRLSQAASTIARVWRMDRRTKAVSAAVYCVLLSNVH